MSRQLHIDKTKPFVCTIYVGMWEGIQAGLYVQYVRNISNPQSKHGNHIIDITNMAYITNMADTADVTQHNSLEWNVNNVAKR